MPVLLRDAPGQVLAQPCAGARHLSRPNQQAGFGHAIACQLPLNHRSLPPSLRMWLLWQSVYNGSRTLGDSGWLSACLVVGPHPSTGQQAHSRSLRSPETSLLAIDTLPLATSLHWGRLQSCCGWRAATRSSGACARLPIPVRMGSKNARPNLRNIPDKIIIRDNFRLTQDNYLIRWKQ